MKKSDYLTPQQAHHKEGTFNKKWKDYRKYKKKANQEHVNQNQD